MRKDGFWKDGALRIHASLLLVVATLLWTELLTFYLFRDLRSDDAYITFQYARNLATGEGFVFNSGERILGTTTPLQTLVMAAVYTVFGERMPELANLLGALAIAAQGTFLFLLARRRAPFLAAFLALATAAGVFGSHAWLALETNLFAALVLGVFWAIGSGREVAAGALLGLAFLCRYDAALLVPFATLWAWGRTGFPKRMLLASFLIVVPWLVFSTSYFGTFLPQTFFAKSGLTPFVEFLADAARGLAVPPLRGTGLSGAFGVVAAWTFAIAGVCYLMRRLPELLPLVSFGALHLVVYSGIGPTLGQYWHLYPTQIAFGVAFLAGVFGWLDTGLVALFARARLGILAGVGAVWILLLGLGTLDFARSFPTMFWLGRRQSDYTRIAEWVAAHTPRDASLAAAEVGTLGYLTRRRMLDPFGLINETNAFPRDRRLSSLVDFVNLKRPDLVLLDNLAMAKLAEPQLTSYRIVKVFPWQTPRAVLLARERPTAVP